MRNPYEQKNVLDIRGALASIPTFKERFEAILADMRRSDIDQEAVAEFTAYFDDNWSDTIGASRELAADALDDAKPYTGTEREDIAKEARWSA